MAFKSSGAVVESVVFNGRRYNRYPESDNPAHRRYFARAGHRLHRDVWKHHNGPIPAGMHVHHIDGNTANNDISNLACVTSKQHWDEHRAQASEHNRRPEHLEHLSRIRGSAADWHRSDEGRAWHREHAKDSLAKTWGKPKSYYPAPYKCVWCGFDGIAKVPTRKKFCSPACQNSESKHRLGKTSYEHPYHASCVRPNGGG